MAGNKIETYSPDVDIKPTDKIIGTDSSTGATVNYNFSDIINFIISELGGRYTGNQVIGVVGDVLTSTGIHNSYVTYEPETTSVLSNSVHATSFNEITFGADVDLDDITISNGDTIVLTNNTYGNPFVAIVGDFTDRVITINDDMSEAVFNIFSASGNLENNIIIYDVNAVTIPGNLSVGGNISGTLSVDLPGKLDSNLQNVDATAQQLLAFRNSIGAGTSNIEIGGGSSQAAAGNHTHTLIGLSGDLPSSRISDFTTEVNNLIASRQSTVAYADMAAFNADSTTIWHQGDYAVIGDATYLYTGAQDATSPSLADDFHRVTSTNDGISQGNADLRYAPLTHTHTASQITDFDTEVSNNTSVNANTAKRSNADNDLRYSQLGHTHVASNITDFTTAVDTVIGTDRVNGAANMFYAQDGTHYTINSSFVYADTPGNVVPWAEGGNTDQIPADKLGNAAMGVLAVVSATNTSAETVTFSAINDVDQVLTDLNVSINTDNFATVSGGAITLPAGQYSININAAWDAVNGLGGNNRTWVRVGYFDGTSYVYGGYGYLRANNNHEGAGVSFEHIVNFGVETTITPAYFFTSENSNHNTEFSVAPGGFVVGIETIATAGEVATLPTGQANAVGNLPTAVLPSPSSETQYALNVATNGTKTWAEVEAYSSSNRLNANLIGSNGNVSNAEYGFLNGVTSAIQTQINGKEATISSSNRVDASNVGTGLVDNTEFNYLNGVTSNIQDQLDNTGSGDYDELTNAPIRREVHTVTIPITGTRTNVVSGGSDEISRIFMRDDFDSGAAAQDFRFTDSTTFTRTGTYDAISFSTGRGFSTSVTVELLTPITVSSVAHRDILDMVWTQLDGETINGHTFTRNSQYDYSVSGVLFVNTSATFAGNPTLEIQGSTSSTSGTTAVVVNAGSVGPTSYSYDPDTIDTIYSHTVEGIFTANSNTNTALTELGTAIAASHSDVTWDGSVVSGATLVGPDLEGSNSFVLPEDIDNSTRWTMMSSLVVDNSNVLTWPEGDMSFLNNNYLVYGGTSGGPSRASYTGVADGDVIRVTIGGATGIFTVESRTLVSYGGRNTGFIELTNGNSYTGTVFAHTGTGAFTNESTFNNIVYDASYIDIDLGTSTNIESSFTITANGGTNVDEAITNFDPVSGSGVHSTITVTDYAGMEITSFTNSAGAASEDTTTQVGTQIANAINNNTETPLDFTAAYDDLSNSVILTSAAGPFEGSWSVSVNNGAADTSALGNLEIGLITSSSTEVNEINTIRLTNSPEGEGSILTTSGNNTVSRSSVVSTAGNITGITPSGANLVTLTTYDTGGGSANDGQWYWRTASGTNTSVNPASWADLGNGNQIFFDTTSDSDSDALLAALEAGDSIFIRTGTGSAEIRISGTVTGGSGDRRITIDDIVRSYGTPGFSGGMTMSNEGTDVVTLGVDVTGNLSVSGGANVSNALTVSGETTLNGGLHLPIINAAGATTSTNAYNIVIVPFGVTVTTPQDDVVYLHLES